MFAFAIWDCVDRVLHIARDPLGIKPLYIANKGKTLRLPQKSELCLSRNLAHKKLTRTGSLSFFYLEVSKNLSR